MMLNLIMYNLSSIWDTFSLVTYLMIRTSCIRRPCITERRMLCCQINISGDLRVQIVQSYSSSFYGSQLWDLSNKCIDRLSISWRKSIRKALNIPVRTHSVYLPLICECLPLNVQLELRIMKFFYERFK